MGLIRKQETPKLAEKPKKPESLTQRPSAGDMSRREFFTMFRNREL